MRRLKDGVSAVVVMSFVLFFAGRSFVYSANQIKGGISGMGEEADIAGATVSLVGKPSIHTTSSLDGYGDSVFYLTLPANSIFSLKFEKAGHITSYSTPTILNSDIGNFGPDRNTDRLHVVLPSNADWANIVSLSGITMQSGKGHLAVMPQNNTTDPGEMLQGAMTAIVNNLSGTVLVNIGNTRYVNLVGESFTLSSTATSNTIGFVVFNLTPGTVITSAQMSSRTFNYRQTIIYANSITSCISLYDGIIESTLLGDFDAYISDENGNPIPSANINLIGVKSTTSDGSGNFTLSNIPYNNIPKATTSTYLQATKTGYKDAYLFDILAEIGGWGSDNIFSFSTTTFGLFASQAGVTIDSSKGCILGIIDGSYERVSGAVGKIYNPDGTLNSARIYYFDSSGNIDPSLTSTSSVGVFAVFNIDPSISLIFTAQKGTLEFPYILDKSFVNGLTWTRITSAPPANPASISGTISYSGTKTGTIGIGLFTTSGFSGAPAYGTTIASPGSYSISNIAPGTYYIGSSMDTNGDGIYDSTLDHSGVYASNPKVLANNQNAVGINITLTDPSGGAAGDINGDGAVNITDVILCLRQAIGLDTPSLLTSDINGDGLVNITDVIIILRKAIGLDARMRSAVNLTGG